MSRLEDGTAVPRIKGIAIRRLLENVEHFYGASVLADVKLALPPDLRARIDYNQIVGGGWYPITWLKTTHAAIRQVTRAGPEIARKFGFRGAMTNFTTIHKVFLSVLSPEWVMRRAPRIFGVFVEQGKLSVLESRSGMAHVKFEGCTLFEASIWESTLGQCEAILELCGARNVRLHVHDGGGDNDYLDATAYWT